MMSNEELVMKIKAGDQSLIPQLWEQVSRFLAWRAGQYFRVEVEDRGMAPSFEVDDLIQEAYFAVLQAINYYDPDKGANFLTILSFPLKSAFGRVAGYRTSRQRNDGLNMNHAISGDAQIGEEDDFTLFDTLPADGPGTEALAIEDEYQRQLHDVLEKAMKTLPEQQADILRRRYYDGETCDRIAADIGCTPQNVSSQEGTALTHLYKGKKLNGLDQFLEEHTDYYAKVGIEQYRATGLSAVEKIAIRRERLVQKWLKKHR